MVIVADGVQLATKPFVYMPESGESFPERQLPKPDTHSLYKYHFPLFLKNRPFPQIIIYFV